MLVTPLLWAATLSNSFSVSKCDVTLLAHLKAKKQASHFGEFSSHRTVGGSHTQWSVFCRDRAAQTRSDTNPKGRPLPAAATRERSHSPASEPQR
jgi:hypothetical protein